MGFFSARPRVTGYTFIHRPVFFVKISVFLLVFAYTFVSLSPIFVAHAQSNARPLNVQAIRNALKQQIRVTHTGHALHPAASQAKTHDNVQPAYNNAGVSDDQNHAAGNLDGGGNSYSAQALQTIGLVPGVNITANNITYSWPSVASGSNDNYQASGQVLSVAPVAGAATVGFLGVATAGNSSGTAILTFTDGTSQTFSLGLSDWTLGGGAQSQPSFGNTIVGAAMAVRNTTTNQQPIPTYLFSAQQALPSGKTLQSVTLPTTVSPGQLHIFALGVGGPAYNNTGVTDDSSTSAGNLDSAHNSYSAQALQSAGLTSGQQFADNDGIAYTWPTAASGTVENYQVSGQILPVTPLANATILGFLGSATGGATSGSGTLSFTDGTTQPFTLGFADWTTSSLSSLPFGNSVAASMTYRNTSSGKQTINTYLFTTEVALPQGKTIQSVTLPTTTSPGLLHVFAVSTRSVLNNVGSSLDSASGTGNFDALRDSYSAQALQAAQFLPGQPFIYNGVSFIWPGSYGVMGDNYQVAGQVISVTPVGQATTLGFIGAGTTGSPSGTATLTYTDGSTQTFTLGFSDWCASTLQYNNQVVARLPYRNTPAGQQSISCGLYYAETTLQTGKTLQSVTLPTAVSTGQMHIFAVGTRSAYNNIGISDDNNPASANFDQGGTSYSEQDFQNPNGPGWNPGDTLAYNGMNFIWPNVPAGAGDNYQAAGQVLAVTPVTGASTLGFVGAATNAGTSGSSGTATITYTDGTTQTFTLGMSDWTLGAGQGVPAFGNRLFALLPHRNLTPQSQQSLNSYLFYSETTLQAGKTLQSVTLPTTVNQGQLHIFMIGTRSGTNYLNNVGTSDDDNAIFASYDGGNSSYSTQALQADHIVAGQTFPFNGVSFTWPASYSVAPDNYQAGGQTIPVTPVTNATTLAFLGSATNGPSSGTATITYTNGSTQTFTLGFADWTVASTNSLPFGNSVAATMSYRNTSTGQQTINTYVFYTAVTLQAGKTIQSVTLPTTVSQGALHVFSVGTRASIYNNAGTSDDAQPFFGNYDGGGASYSLQALQSTGLAAGQSFTTNGVTFTWPNVAGGLFNNNQAGGQVIPVNTVANATTLAFLGSATIGPSSGTTTITYTDGSTQTFTLGFADWAVSSTNSLPFGNSVAATMSYRNTSTGQQAINTYVFYTAVTLQTGKTIQSVTLPTTVTQGALHVFTVGTK